MQFHDVYDNRVYFYNNYHYNPNITTYVLNNTLPVPLSDITFIKDIYLMNNSYSSYYIESKAVRLNRNDYEIIGTYGSNNINISFNFELNSEFFAIEYTLENYSLPKQIILTVQSVKNEVAHDYTTINCS